MKCDNVCKSTNKIKLRSSSTNVGILQETNNSTAYRSQEDDATQL